MSMLRQAGRSGAGLSARSHRIRQAQVLQRTNRTLQQIWFVHLGPAEFLQLLQPTAQHRLDTLVHLIGISCEKLTIVKLKFKPPSLRHHMCWWVLVSALVTDVHNEYVYFSARKRRSLTRRPSMGNTKSVAESTILLGPFERRFLSK